MSDSDDYIVKTVYDLDGKPWYVFVRKSEILKPLQDAENGRNKTK